MASVTTIFCDMCKTAGAEPRSAVVFVEDGVIHPSYVRSSNVDFCNACYERYLRSLPIRKNKDGFRWKEDAKS